MTKEARPRITSGQETEQRGLDGLNLNVPDGKPTGLVVTRPGEPARPRRRRKGHESHRRGAERQCHHPQRLRFTDSEFEDRLRKETGRAPIAPARFYSFTDAEANTKEQIQKARSHPWISPDVPVRGFVFDVLTGRLSEVFPDRETVTGQ